MNRIADQVNVPDGEMPRKINGIWVFSPPKTIEKRGVAGGFTACPLWT